ncbi:uncharacterized protein PGTG_21539 [Puccinia graminis f. sp. tritici CRL 75-36-700-3]|uniref:No apical meristem-associated C-terminal domain-containing protein n=1 Tax=Puccinia graminis f. sp. tritici (strain CRL 75-36-700-3 / race SCCL) TaxID=418459 RepID=H6QRR7_PUCGT|nr:uncharacterized protein PGTG_21539 [Puccinia graminis f. sp. tritici CRL 75-36-700-3]EHS63364.1 hypothetical protein PGTG_21539 [Puccinia graminis f. sp. tritici CRL 75-36-700-3]
MQSFEEVDPSLLAASQDPTFSVPSLNSIASKPPPNKKHTRRTKKQMALARGEDITNNEQTASQKRHKSSQRQRGSQKKGTQSTQKTITENDNNPQFILTDYENICSYLEDDEKFSELYGDTKTNVGPKVLTKTAAFNIFAIFINAHSNKRLNLTGRQLQQRVNYYIRKKYFPAKQWENQTGAGILEMDPHASIDEALEAKCPCYAKMDAIFAEFDSSNPTPTGPSQKNTQERLAEFDSSNPTPTGPRENNTQDRESSPEVFYPGWDESESPPAAQRSVGDNVVESMIPPLLGDGEESDVLPQSTPASVPASLVRTNPDCTQGQAQSTPTPAAPRRGFPNQANSNETGPPRDRADKSKSSLATAYQSVSDKKYEMLKSALKDKKTNDDRRFEWDKERYEKDQSETKLQRESEEKMQAARLEAEEKKQNARLAAAERWISQGKSVTEIDILLKAVFP